MTASNPWRHEPREFLTDHQKAKLFLEREGVCHRCTAKIRGRKWYVEHLVSLSCGGTNAWENLGVTCENCFPDKNREDARKAARGRAVATACVIPPSQRQKRHRLRKPPGTYYDWQARRYVKTEATDADP